jgi:thioredoxin reductase (NADPH)
VESAAGAGVVSPSHHQVVIVGSGPAGLTAAIYTARASLSPLMLEGEPSSTSDQPGGQLMLTTEVENFPGFPDGIMGPELMGGFRAQALRFGADIRTVKATKVDFTSGSPFGIWVGDPSASEPTHTADAVIVATGAQSLMLGLPAEQRLLGHGLSTCATCDGFFFREHDIAVVGGGDSAIEEAIFLTRFGRTVTIIHRRDSLRASKIMQDRALANPKIKFQWDSEIVSMEGEGKVSGLRVRNVHSGEETVLPVGGVFIAIGHLPRSELFTDQLATNPDGYLEVEGRSTRTKIEGVFACGDVVDHVYRQAITAAGSGCSAAIDAERWLAEQAHASA